MDSDDFAQWSQRPPTGARTTARRCATGRCGRAPRPAKSRRRSRRRRPKRPSRWRRSSPISRTTIVPGMTHWQHPRFFAYFPANAAPVSVVAEYLVSGDGGAMHALADLAGGDRARDQDDRLAAPGARPARRLLRRDPGFGLVGDARRRAHHARARARLGGQQAGLAGQPATAHLLLRPGPYLDRPRHLGRRHRRGQSGRAFRPTGRCAAWMPAALEAAIVGDRAAGLLPAGIIASVGGTSVGGTDDVAARLRGRQAARALSCMSTRPGPARR